MDDLLTVKEAAEITRLKPKTLYAYAERRIIPHPGRKQASCSGMQPYIKLGESFVFYQGEA
jgi:Helix-turn-helix domain